MRSLVGARLPVFSSEEAKDLKGSFDFLGFNYYSTDFTINNPNPQNSLDTDYVLDARANISCKFDMYCFNYHLISWQSSQSNSNTSSDSCYFYFYLILPWCNIAYILVLKKFLLWWWFRWSKRSLPRIRCKCLNI